MASTISPAAQVLAGFSPYWPVLTSAVAGFISGVKMERPMEGDVTTHTTPATSCKSDGNGLTEGIESGYGSGESETSDQPMPPSDTFKRLEAQIRAEIRAEIRDEVFAEGWKAAMDSIRRATSQLPAHSTEDHPLTDVNLTVALLEGASDDALPRGVTNIVVEEILRAVAPRALTPTQIVKAAAERDGTKLRDSSVGRALRRLAGRKIVEQVNETSMWRYVSQLRSVS